MTRINQRTLIQRAKDLVANMWVSKLLFQELPLVDEVEESSEVAVMSKETRGDGVLYRMVRISAEDLFESGSGTGVLLNGIAFGGVKSLIELDETLTIPEFWQYNLFQSLDIDGTVDNDGQINFIA